jgi:shikimate 5-dehydrogenase
MVVDLIYNPAETKLLTAARALGLETENGLSMLACQGILSDELFFDIRPNREKLYQAAYSALAAEC